MKKSSTVAAVSKKNFNQRLTVGLDLGDRSSWYCMLDEAGKVVGEKKLGTTRKAMKEVFAAIPRSRIALETGHALTVGKSAVERTGPRSDRGARSQRPSDRREPPERRSAGCQDAGTAGANRPAVTVSGETS